MDLVLGVVATCSVVGAGYVFYKFKENLIYNILTPPDENKSIKEDVKSSSVSEESVKSTVVELKKTSSKEKAVKKPRKPKAVKTEKVVPIKKATAKKTSKK